MIEEKPQTIQQRENGSRKRLKTLLATARGIISFELGLPVGVRKLRQIINWLILDGIVIKLPILDEYNAATLSIPTGKERLNCSRAALRQYDAQLNPINLKFHDRVIDACFHLIDEYGEIEKVLETADDSTEAV